MNEVNHHIMSLIGHRLVKSAMGVVTVLLLVLAVSCARIPELHLHEDNHLVVQFPLIELSLDIYWDYATEYGWDYDFQYNWRSQWEYGWDAQDTVIFGGPIGYSKKPESFQIRRYYLGQNPDFNNIHHAYRDADQTNDTLYLAKYQLGYYDLLVWNNVETIDGVQALNYEEGTTPPYDSVIAYTNTSRMVIQRAPAGALVSSEVRYQPEALFAGSYDTVHITDNPHDYVYDSVLNIYRKRINMMLYPVTYIYLVQLILHHNHNSAYVGINGGGIANVQGDAVLTGMASSTILNTGIAREDETAVYFNTRMKEHLTLRETGEDVDIIGGRLYTFGICGVNPNNVAKRDQVLGRSAVESLDGSRPISAMDLAAMDSKQHFVGIQVSFRNAVDTTLYFDVTDSIRKYYKGGVICLELDMDTVKVPHKGSGLFDAVVVAPEEEQYEFDL